MKRMRLAAWAAALAGLGLLSGCQSSDPCGGGRPTLMSRLGFRGHNRGTVVGTPVSGMPISSLAPDCCDGPMLGHDAPMFGNGVPYGIPSPAINGGPFLDAAPTYPGFNGGSGAPILAPPDTGFPGAIPGTPAPGTLPPPTLVPGGEPRLNPVPNGNGLAQPTPATPSVRRRW